MSQITCDEWVAEQIDEMDLNGRDEFRTHLITQEIPFFYQDTLDGKTVDVDWLIKRRGFNEIEQKKIKALAKFFNDNGQKIRMLWARLEE
jgi:hypothetical protein